MRRLFSLAVFFVLVALGQLAQAGAPPQITSFQASCASPCADSASISLSASVYVTSPATVREVAFYRSGQATPLATRTASPWKYTWSGVAPGSYSFTAVVTDSTGAQGTSNAQSIKVVQTPQVTLSAPAAGANLLTGSPVTLTASITDPDNIGVSNVNFYNAASWIAGASSPSAANTFSASATFTKTGAASLTAVAYNNRGTKTTSPVVNVTLSAPPANVPPPRITSFDPVCAWPCADAASIALSATAYANSPNTIRQVDFYLAGQATPLATVRTAPYQYTWKNAPPGTHVLSAVVTDSAGQQGSSATKTIRVWRTPQVALTAPLAGATVAAGVPVTLIATITDPDGIGVTPVNFYNGAHWVAGASTPASPNTFVVTATFAQAGPLNLLAVAYNNLGTSTTSATLSVMAGTTASPPPASTGPFAYLAIEGADRLAVVDTARDALLASVPVGAGPQSVAIAPDGGRVYVANAAAATVSILDATLPGVVGLIALPNPPRSLAVSPDGARLYVSGGAANAVQTIDLTTQNVFASIAVGSDPQGLALNREGSRLFVANRADASISVLATASNTLLVTWPLPATSEPTVLALDAAGARLFVTAAGTNALYVLDATSGALLSTVPLPMRPRGLALSSDETKVLVSNGNGLDRGEVTVVKLADGSVRHLPLPTGARPIGVAMHPDASRIYVASQSEGLVHVLDAATGAILSSVAVGSGPYALGHFIAWPQTNLALISPMANAWVNQARPKLEFAWATRCLTFDCQLGEDYYRGAQLLVSIGGAAAAGSTTFTAGRVEWIPDAPLAQGSVNFSALLKDRLGRYSNAVSSGFQVDAIAPRFTTISPPSGSVLFHPNTNLTGSVDEGGATITLGGAAPQAGPNFNFPLTLNAGLNTQSLVATDPAANSTTAVVNLTYAAFALTISAPEDNATVSTATVTVRGSFSNATSAGVTVNGLAASITGQEFNVEVPLAVGLNTLTITATRADDGQVQTQTRQVHRTSGNQAPTLSVSPYQNIVLPSVATLQAKANDDGLPGPLSYAWVQESGPAAAWIARRSEASTTAHFVQAGVYVFRVTVSDGELSATATTEVRVTEPPLPPDPATIAPPIDPTLPAVPGITAKFLYTGANPIQTGVNPDTIDAKRAAVMRGKLLTRDNQPLSGATVTIHGHPEFGQTRSRADGMFDLVVNGGGTLTLNFEKPGYLPAQRQLQVPWQDYAIAPEVVLIPLDPNVTPITLSSTVAQLARGGVVSDERGTRSATVFFPAGTTAAMVLPDGSQVPLDTLHFRATEYTVGPNGPQAMPGELPPASAYTYAVELSADEAFYAGAKSVQFSQPVAVYVDNFIGFPAGMDVPVGWYDRERVAWVAANDGRVIKLLGVTDGLAQLDVDGSGIAAAPDQLEALGVSDDELNHLTLLFSPGQTVWRIRTNHLTPFDCNWPALPDQGADPPDQPPPADDDPKDDCDSECGSMIEVQNGMLKEKVAVSGTQHALTYRSEYVPGRKTGVRIQVSGATVPPNLAGIALKFDIAGRIFHSEFPPLPNQYQVFEWDGKDTFGRPVEAAQPLNVAISYRYPSYYCWPQSLLSVSASPAPPKTESTTANPSKAAMTRGERMFGGYCSARVEPRRAGPTISLSQTGFATVGAASTVQSHDSRVFGMGGWFLDSHHIYDPIARVLRIGDGTQRSGAHKVSRFALRAVAGNGSLLSSANDDGKAALRAGVTPNAIAVSPDGTVYFGDSGNDTVRAVSPDGLLRTVAGVPREPGGGEASTEFAGVASKKGVLEISKAGRKVSGDGGPATLALLKPMAIALDHRGNLFIADRETHSVRRVAKDGIIDTVAGNGTQGFGGDGGPAVEATLNGYFMRSIAVANDGNIFVLDYRRVRRIGPDGIIATVIGSGLEPPSGDYGEPGVDNGDGGAAAQAGISLSASSISVGPDGSIFIADGDRIRRVGADGIIRTVAGRWGYVSPGTGDGGPAGDATLRADSLAVGPDGTIYLADSSGKTVRAVAPDGIIRPLVHGAGEWSEFVCAGHGALLHR